MLGTTGDRAHAAELGQHALAAADALFRPGRLFFQDAHVLRIERGIHGLAGKALGNGLHASGAAERHHGLAALHCGRQVLDELVVALALDGETTGLTVSRLIRTFEAWPQRPEQQPHGMVCRSRVRPWVGTRSHSHCWA